MENEFKKKKDISELYEQVEILLEKKKENIAIEQLMEIQQNYPAEYIICMLKMIDIYNTIGEKRKVEMTYQKALKEVSDLKDRWIIMASFAAYCKDNHMYLKMDKLSKQLISDYPDNYFGYHIHVLMEIGRNHYSEAETYMKKIPERFHRYPEYLADYIDLLEKQGDVNKLLNYIDNTDEVLDIIPAYALKKKIDILNKQKNYKEIDKITFILATGYGDYDAILSMMILSFSKGDYELSARIAKYIFDKENEPLTYHYYYAKLFQIFNLYMLSNKQPKGKIKDYILSSIDWVNEYLKIQEIENKELEELFIDIQKELENDNEKIVF